MAEMIETRWHSTHFKLNRWHISDQSFATEDEARAHEKFIEKALWDAVKNLNMNAPDFDAMRMAALASQPIHERMFSRAEAEECLKGWGGRLSFCDDRVRVHVRRGSWRFARGFWAEQEACNFAAALDTMAGHTAHYDQSHVRDRVTDLFSDAVGHDYDDLIFSDDRGWYYCFYHGRWDRQSEKFCSAKCQSRLRYASRDRAVHGFDELWAMLEGCELENWFYEKPRQAETFRKQLLTICLVLPPERRKRRRDEASRLVQKQDGIASP